jgi:hypothetical protein
MRFSAYQLPNLHAPERQPDESFADYKRRRAESNKVGRKAGGHGLNGGENSRKTYRAQMRRSGTMGRRTRAYAALMAAWAARRVMKAKLRNEHGAYTLVGAVYEMEGEDLRPTPSEHLFGGCAGPDGYTSYTARRIWLAGISAQRGY